MDMCMYALIYSSQSCAYKIFLLRRVKKRLDFENIQFLAFLSVFGIWVEMVAVVTYLNKSFVISDANFRGNTRYITFSL